MLGIAYKHWLAKMTYAGTVGNTVGTPCLPYGFDMLLYVRPMLATILPEPLGLSPEGSVHPTPR